MTTPLFHPTLPDPSDPAHLAPYQILLEWLVRINQWHIARSLRRCEKGLSQTAIPPLYVSRARYRAHLPSRAAPSAPAEPTLTGAARPRPASREGGFAQTWFDAPAVLARGGGDVEDLAAWRCAELRVHGVEAEPVVGWEWAPGTRGSRGPGRFAIHALVKHPDGKLEDPSAILGRRGFPARPLGGKPLIHLTLPDVDDGAHFAPLQIALEGLTDLDTFQILHHRKLARLGKGAALPPLYQSGVYYEEEPPGHEDWLDAPAVLRQGFADCEDLAAWRCAELRADGVQAEPVIKWQWIPRETMIQQGYPADKLPARGVWLVHCCVRYPNGHVEDPSKILGMGGNFLNRI